MRDLKQPPQEADRQPRSAATTPLQLPRVRVRSEIHRVPDVAPGDGGWRMEKIRRSRRRQPPSKHWQESTHAQGRKPLLAAMEGRCFNYLARGHLWRSCREPTRCLRCKRPGHRSLECKQPDRRRQDLPRPRISRTTQSEPRLRVVASGSQSSSSAAASGPRVREQEGGQPRTRRRRRRGCRDGGHRKREVTYSASERSHRSPSPSSPSPERCCDADADLCYIDRLGDTDQWEAEYEYLGVLVQILSTRPPVTPE